MIDYDIEKELRPNLSSNEKLIWTGKPKSGLLLRSSDALLIPFSLIWGGFVVFWEVMVINMGAPFFFTLFGIPFILIGIYLTIGRFFIDAKKRANTFYGITNDRILIKTGIFNSEINSINIQTLPEITYNQKAD